MDRGPLDALVGVPQPRELCCKLRMTIPFNQSKLRRFQDKSSLERAEKHSVGQHGTTFHTSAPPTCVPQP